MKRRFLIVCFDALRPDMVTPELMPNLSRFARNGVHCSHHRAVFPTETRVNQASLVTGCYPGLHGIVGNRFLDPVASPGRLFNTGDETELVEGDRRLKGKLVDVPVLGEIIAERGLTLAALSSGTPGGARMLNHKAESLGGFRFAMHRPDASVPRDRIKAATDLLGPVPDHTVPSNEWLTYATDAYLHYIEPELRPDVCILWFCEPDNSFHYCGIGSEQNLNALRHADAQFGRILEWCETSDMGRSLQILSISDHGQITITGSAVNLTGGLKETGLSVGESIGNGADATLAVDSAGGIYVRDSDPDLIQQIIGWLQQQPWCGPLFTSRGGETFSFAQAGLDHRRAPDIGLVLRSSDVVNEHGMQGSCRHDTGTYPVGGGLHGGLHAIELNSWMAVSGDAFRTEYHSERPTGIVDILPTVLHILGFKVPDHVQGRILNELLRDDAGISAPAISRKTYTADGTGNYGAKLSVSFVGSTFYLEKGWVC